MAAAPVVTALTLRGRSRVAVALDGRPWRVIPAEAVYTVGVHVGAELDRATARALGRELRRLEARGRALRALRARDHTAASLEQRLADRGTAEALRRETVADAREAGLIDDRRYAQGRAEALVRRGAGNLLIADDLERHGVSPANVRETVEGLEPEATRIATIVRERGLSGRTVRYLAARGFAEEAVESLVATLAAESVE